MERNLIRSVQSREHLFCAFCKKASNKKFVIFIGLTFILTVLLKLYSYLESEILSLGLKTENIL
jgi:hypothetical protein